MLNTLIWLLSGWERRLCHSLLSGSSWPILNYFVVYKLSLPSESLAGFSAIIDTCFQGFSKPRPCPSPCPSPFSEHPGPQTRLFLHFISLEFNLFLWANESRLSEPYLSTLFSSPSSFAYVWGLWKSEPGQKKYKYSELFRRMPGS